MKTVINVVSISEKKILLCRKKGVWILPGGKLEESEEDIDCLYRECSEEIPGAQLNVGVFFGSFTGTTPFSKTQICAKVYFGSLTGDITPSAEIEATSCFSREHLENLEISDITREIVTQLISKKVL